MAKRWETYKIKWDSLKNSGSFRNVLLFLMFVIVATLLWFIFAMNDNVSHNFDVNLKIGNVPDSVTFINDVPKRIRVTVSDKGTALLRHVVTKNRTLNINFSDYASEGILRVPKDELMSSLKSLFGNNALLSSVSLDSVSLKYTTLPGKRVPIDVLYDIEPALGNVLYGKPELSQSFVYVFSNEVNTDTILSLQTKRIVKRDLKETSTFTAELQPMKGVKIVPSEISVTFNIEPLVKKQSMYDVTAENVPEKESLIFFPSKVSVSYFIPMSRFNDPIPEIVVSANYSEAENRHSGKIGLMITKYPSWCENATLMTDSVEYTLIK